MPLEDSAVYQARVAHLREYMVERSLGAVVIYAAPMNLGPVERSSGNVRYFCGWAHSFRPSALVVPRTGRPALVLVAACDEALVTGERLDEGTRGYGTAWSGVDVRRGTPRSVGAVALSVVAERGDPGTDVGFIGRREMSVAQFDEMTASPAPGRLVDIDDYIERVRQTKDDGELADQRAAAAISDRMISSAMTKAADDGAKAWQVLNRAKATAIDAGASYVTAWISTGLAPTAWGHDAHLAQQDIHDGDRVDVGTYVTYRGYYGHSIRMGVRGQPSDLLQSAFDGLREVQEIGVAQLRPGNSVHEVYRAIEQAIKDRTPIRSSEDPFRFRQAHGLGLSYDEPIVSDAFELDPETRGRVELTIEPGMVFEVHPNYSVPGLGLIRHGDMYLVTEEKAERLTGVPHAIVEI